MKCKRGQKKCTNCNAINGARSFACKNCGTEFTMKKFRKGRRRILITDHTILKRGDTIRVVGGSGPYYEDSNGEKTYLVDRGKYTVYSIEQNGIHAYGSSGYNYLYMGETHKSDLLESITRAPCKILLIRK